MSYLKYSWIALVMGILAVGTPAQAEDGICVITAIAFDQNLNPLPVQGESMGTVGTRNLVKGCRRDKLIATDAARAACQGNQESRFVALFRRIDGVDLVRSKDSRAKFNEKNPLMDQATIRMKSCDYWMAMER